MNTRCRVQLAAEAFSDARGNIAYGKDFMSERTGDEAKVKNTKIKSEQYLSW